MTSLGYLQYSEINDSSAINMNELEKKKLTRHNITVKKRHDTNENGANAMGANAMGANAMGANAMGSNSVGANGIGANAMGANETSENVQNMLKLINNSNGYENEDANSLADFNPPPRAQVSTKIPTFDSQNTRDANHSVQNNIQAQNMMQKRQNNIQNTNGLNTNDLNIDYEKPTTIQNNNDDMLNVSAVNPRQYPAPLDSYEGFNTLPKTYASDYYKQYVPYFNQTGGQNMNKNQILEKLNYMIHLLEEQKDEKTGHVMEEVILYSFLGVFIIFIVDSFARVGKYTR
jgi:hypothetical protein